MVRMVLQRGVADCGLAALAILLSAHAIEYDAVAAKAPRGAERDGLLTRELVATARRLGVTLTAARSYDLDVDAGVLRVRSHVHHRHGHWVTVRYGLVFDPHDGTARPWRDFAAKYRARFGMLARA